MPRRLSSPLREGFSRDDRRKRKARENSRARRLRLSSTSAQAIRNSDAAQHRVRYDETRERFRQRHVSQERARLQRMDNDRSISARAVRTTQEQEWVRRMDVDSTKCFLSKKRTKPT